MKARNLVGLMGLSVLVACSALALAREGATGWDAHITREDVGPIKKPFSPYVNKAYPNRVYWGDTHLHTMNSPDAFFFGVRLGPDEAFRFAKGEQLTCTTGTPAKLVRPLDFLVVADHSEYLGMMRRLFEGDPEVLGTEYGKELFALANATDDGQFQAAMAVIGDLSNNEEKMVLPELQKTIWDEVAGIADGHNQPGTFTAFIGYEWTSMITGNNLHRVVIFKDDAERATRAVPFSSFDSVDPEDLWRYMAQYERTTGGEVLAIPHNGNLSNGMMFQTTRINGDPLTRLYAEARMKWEPLVEVTQIKGDGEVHPLLSPNDEFADYEQWDIGNLDLSEAKEDDMLQYEYARSALKLGLQLEKELGVNPFQFGMIGSTDSHTGLATAKEDNFFGKHTGEEPSTHRATGTLAELSGRKVYGWEQVASGLAAVWARENTREGLFNAMERRETYATTGSRMLVRVFGGYDFEPDDVVRPDFADTGYMRGVPMGGELLPAPEGKAPAFMVRALRDPDGANLDRVQIIKGWLDKDDELHERIYDVAVSDGRTIGEDGRCGEAVGSTVDVEVAAYTNTIGDALMMAYWKDPDFDPAERALYYVRVIEIPTPRWTAYDKVRLGAEIPDESPMTTQERAYTSPIWYTPRN